MSAGPILVDSDGPLTRIRIDRAERRNALDRAASAALRRAFDAFEADAEARVAVLGGVGGCFCAGADLREMAEGELYEPWGASADGPTARVLSKPVIAAVEGHACAGGLGLALWCDLRVVDEDTVFGVFSRRWGVPMSDGTTVRLPRIVGLGRALDLLLTGRPVGGREAFEIGLASRLVGRGEVWPAARALALEIAALPQAALRCDRRSALALNDRPLDEALRRESEAATEVRDLEAVAAARRWRESSE